METYKVESYREINTLEYRVWQHIKARCYNKKSDHYKYYGGRGITVCGRWRNNFIVFFKDMGQKPFPKAQIDRIDNDGNYEPANCRWVTCVENIRNSTRAKLTMQKAREIRVLYNEGGISQYKLAVMFGVAEPTIYYLLHNKTWREKDTKDSKKTVSFP